MKKIAIGLTLFVASLLAGAMLPAQSPYSVNIFKSPPITATSTTSGAINLGTVAATPKGGSYSAGMIQITGVALTTATFGVTASSDNGVTYFAVPICTVAVTPSCATTQTATASAIYMINLAGLTHIKYVTSGTFTATSITLLLTASPNAQVAKSSGGGTPAACTDGNNYDCLNIIQIITATKTFSGSATLPELSIINPQTGAYGPACAFFQPATGTFTDHQWYVGVGGCNSFSDQAAFTICAPGNGSTDCSFVLPNANVTGGWIENPMAIGTHTPCGTNVKTCTPNLSVTGAAVAAAAGQVNYGGTTAASSNCGTLITAVACIVVNVAGTTHYIPYY